MAVWIVKVVVAVMTEGSVSEMLMLAVAVALALVPASVASAEV